jgi:hypothetical protein
VLLGECMVGICSYDFILLFLAALFGLRRWSKSFLVACILLL